MLAVAARFATAYMPYQVGRLTGWARAAIERTCTPAFARLPALAARGAIATTERAPDRRRDLPRRQRQPRRRLEPRIRELRLRSGSGRHRRISADPRPPPQPLGGRRPGDVNSSAKAVAVRARAYHPPAPAGGNARAQRGQRIPGAMRRRPAWGGRTGRRGPDGRHSDLPGRSRGVRPRRSGPVDPRRNQLRRVDVRHLHPPRRLLGHQPSGSRRADADRHRRNKPATPGTRSKSTLRAIRPGSRRTSTTRPTPYTAPPTTCRHPARPGTGPARSSPTTTQTPTSSRSSPWPPPTTPRA